MPLVTEEEELPSRPLGTSGDRGGGGGGAPGDRGGASAGEAEIFFTKHVANSLGKRPRIEVKIGRLCRGGEVGGLFA